MDDRRFDLDALARSVAGDPGPRRAALRLLAGGGLALLARLPEGAVEAAKRRRCPRKRRCGKECCTNTQACLGGRCRAKGPCGGSRCLGQRCGSNKDYCLCTSSVEGVGFCLDGFAATCEGYKRCTSSSQCPNGLCLATADCCGGKNLCVPRSKACPSGTKTVRPWA